MTVPIGEDPVNQVFNRSDRQDMAVLLSIIASYTSCDPDQPFLVFGGEKDKTIRLVIPRIRRVFA